MSDNQFSLDGSDPHLIKDDIARMFRSQLWKLEPHKLCCVSVLLLAIERLPLTTPNVDVRILFSQPNRDGNYGWADISISEEELRLSIGEHFYDSAVGGDTETHILFEAIAGTDYASGDTDYASGDIERWLEHAAARSQDGALVIDDDNTDYSALDWYDYDE